MLLLSTIALALSFTRWRRTGQLLLGIAPVVLWIAATPICANWLTWHLESEYPPVSIDQLPQSDVVIVLGGILGQPLPPRIEVELGDPVDRVVEAWRIYRAGKARFIVISAGNQPEQSGLVPEAELIADFIVELGVPRSALVLDTESRNTRENAVNTAAILKEHGWRSGLLVTSGTHMPRALAAFRRTGAVVIPASTDIHGRPFTRPGIVDVLPEVGSLARSTAAIKEIIGLWVYRYRGWA